MLLPCLLCQQNDLHSTAVWSTPQLTFKTSDVMLTCKRWEWTQREREKNTSPKLLFHKQAIAELFPTDWTTGHAETSLSVEKALQFHTYVQVQWHCSQLASLTMLIWLHHIEWQNLLALSLSKTMYFSISWRKEMVIAFCFALHAATLGAYYSRTRL